MNEWKKAKLGDVLQSVSITHKNIKERMVLINTSDILEGKILHNTYSETKDMVGQFKKSISKNDILYSEIRPKNKRFALVDFEASDYIVSTKLMVLRKKIEELDVKFIYHVLTSEIVINELQVMAETRSGTFPQITFSEISRLEINLPSLEEQKAIADVLSALDDKIELNNRINKNLEEQAQVIFKRWFVDFEFHDENGNPYKSSGGEMIDSELGEIPKGWRVKSLDEIADFLNGLAMQKFRPKSYSSIPVIKIRELNMGATDSNSELTDVNIDNRYVIKNGEVIFSWSGSLNVKIWTGGIGGLNQHLFKVTSNSYEKWFYYFWLKYHLENFINIANDKATTMGHIKREHLTQAKVIVPSNINRIDGIMVPLLDKIISNNIENQKLAELRDYLLPKLMSGEIKVNYKE